MSDSKQRIVFIDFAKGICILLVILLHTNEIGANGVLSYIRMPFYFLISGMFFKDYGGLLNLVVKKVNKLLLPFVFFYTLMWVAYWITEFVRPGFWPYTGSYFGDLWNSTYMNGPMWFLLTLFWCNIIYFVIQKFVGQRYTSIVVLLLAIIGYLLIDSRRFSPFYLYQSFLAMPFYYLGNIMRHTKLVTAPSTWCLPLIAVLLVCMVCVLEIFSTEELMYVYFYYKGNILLYYIKATMMVFAILLLCKSIERSPVVSYCGRYSIIILGIHQIITKFVSHIPSIIGLDFDMTWFCFPIVVALCIVSIPLMKKWFPYFTAQKDLIKSNT